MHKLIATWFGIGYIRKGGGSVAALFVCLVLYGLIKLGIFSVSPIVGLAIALFLLFLGIWSGDRVEPFWGKDSYRVVIDEVAGMWITMLFVPFSIFTLTLGFILFRIFDIWKPLFIRKMEKLNGGLGVMMDDVLAGVYSCVILNLVYRNFNFHS